MNITTTKVLTFQESCAYLGYKKSYMYKLTSAGILPFSKLNGKTIFCDREKLEEWTLSNASSSSSSSSMAEKQINAATLVTTH